ncbi:hypothetical protein [Streptomyces sp. NPDC001108]
MGTPVNPEALSVLGTPLPAGRTITSDEGDGDERPLWLADVPATAGLWARVHAEHPRTGRGLPGGHARGGRRTRPPTRTARSRRRSGPPPRLRSLPRWRPDTVRQGRRPYTLAAYAGRIVGADRWDFRWD